MPATGAFRVAIATATCPSCSARVELAGAASSLLIILGTIGGANSAWRFVPGLEYVQPVLGFALLITTLIFVSALLAHAGALIALKRPRLNFQSFKLLLVIAACIILYFLLLAFLGHVT